MSVTAKCVLLAMIGIAASAAHAQDLDPQPFGPEFANLDSDATGEWWKPTTIERGPNKGKPQEPRLLVPRDQVVAFAPYKHDHGVLKLSAQLYPLMPDEPRTVTLEFKDGDQWNIAAESPVLYPGWSAHFRVENWDHSRSAVYRVRLADQSHFEGMVQYPGWPITVSIDANDGRKPVGWLPDVEVAEA